ncbi:MAG: ComEC/Rec2 family competence protein [Acidiferrobacteraceae bacterium]
MNIVTINVGQGACAVVRHRNEAIIVDCHIPAVGDDTVPHIREVLSVVLKGHCLTGLILTGFDNDHSDATGAAIILRKYRPDWVMYPGYYKKSNEAKKVFALIDSEVEAREKTSTPLQRRSVRLERLTSRRLAGISDNLDFELFSPHVKDMDNSNNSSIVLKLTGRGAGGFSYLITGDTERARWEIIQKVFRGELKAHVLAAPHHGSKNAVHPASLVDIAPHTVLISAGVNSQYGHPHPEAVKVYKKVAKYVYSTNDNGGVTLITGPGDGELKTAAWSHR